MLTTLLATLIGLGTPALPGLPPPHVDLEVVRSLMLPLARIGESGVIAPLGPMSPPGFGLDAGRLRHLATSDVVGVTVVEVADAAGGALFALPHASGVPIRLAATTSVGFDVALSPDGRRLLYVDGHHPTVVGLAPPYPAPVVIVPTALALAALPKNLADMRVERVRWLDDTTIVFEVETYHRRENRIATTIEAAPADGSAPARRLVTPSGAQDRLAAVLGDTIFFYRDGVLHHAAPDRPAAPIGQRFDTGVVGVFGPHVIATRGESGVERTIGLLTLDASGREQPLARPRKAWLDPVPTPDGQALLWSVHTSAGWIVERIALDGSTRALTPPAPSPIELARFVPGSTSIAGCRGDAVVVFDHVRVGAPRVLTRAPENPSCTIRGATTAAVVFERRLGNGWRVELWPIGDARTPTTFSDASVATVTGLGVIVQTGFEGVAKIVGRALGREVTLVPWQHADIVDARRSPDGRTVVFRVGDRTKAVRVDRPGVVIELTGPHSDTQIVGLTNDRLVGWHGAGRRFVSWRLDGSEANHPTTVLDVAFPGPYAHVEARVVGALGDGTIVSAPVDRSAPPVVVLRGTSWGSLGYDAVHGRIVAPSFSSGRMTIVSARVGGEDVDHPRVLGAPRPPDEASVHHIEVLASGNVQVEYATSTTAMPHPAGSDVLAFNGSGYRPSAEVRRLTWPFAPAPTTSAPGPDPWSGAELRTPIE